MKCLTTASDFRSSLSLNCTDRQTQLTAEASTGGVLPARFGAIVVIAIAVNNAQFNDSNSNFDFIRGRRRLFVGLSNHHCVIHRILLPNPNSFPDNAATVCNHLDQTCWAGSCILAV